jgi:O-antigen/teichoic acid export membrane protein
MINNARKTINDFTRLAKSKPAKQTSILYGSQIIVLFFGIFIGVINTRFLGPIDYGILAFVLAILSFVSLFFEFGFFSAGARLLALANNEKEEKSIIGGLLVITIGIALSFSLFIFLLSFFVDSIFKTEIGGILRIISILVSIYPFQYMLQQVCQGANRIAKMSAYNIMPTIWYLVGALIIITFFKLTVFLSLLLTLSGVIFATVFVISSLKPNFYDLKENIALIWKETKEYGFHVYLGRVAGMATFDLDIMLIPYFVNTTSVGFYSLAMTLTTPMVLLPGSLATSLFKDFAQRDRIPKKVIYFNFLFLLSCVIALILLGDYIVTLLFSEKFLPVVPLILPLAVANLFRGMIQPYNKFLGAKGEGEALRNTAFILTGSNLVGNFTLIPFYGALGAAYASLFALFINYFGHIYYYHKCLGKRYILNRGK